MNKSNDNLTLYDVRPSRADAVKNRQLLVDTAIRLFRQEGVDSVSMSQIAEAAGVGKGTLYRHFNNKSELCHALLDRDMHDVQERTLERLKDYPNEAYENLRWFIAEVALFIERNHALLLEASTTGNLMTLEIAAHVWWGQTILGLLTRLNPPGDIAYMCDVLYVMLDIKTIHFQRFALDYSLQRIIDGLNQTLDCFLSPISLPENE